MSTLNLNVTPADDLIDVARHIRVTGAPPGARVQIASRTLRAGVAWRSHASFVADAAGCVDLTLMPPVAGDYDGVAAMGLLWSQRPEQPEDGRSPLFHADPGLPLVTSLEAEAEEAKVHAELVQRLCAAGISQVQIRERGLVGSLFLPAGCGPHPAVMILNGSGGGINAPHAALYASRGYAAFALGYFRAPGLPEYISNTPLEYFAEGLDWLRAAVKPRDDFVAISGQSRGGELALLLGATFPEKISAVLAYVPSALVHSGQSACDPAIGREGPAWLLGGRPLVHQWQDNHYASWAPFDEGPAPHRHALAMLTALQDEQAVARARILVEKIEAPVLLLSATDDGAWPSSLYARMIRDKLAAVAHPHAVLWHDYRDAGHAILFPYVPTTQITYRHPVSGRLNTGGGTPLANALADQHSWHQAQRFLENALLSRISSRVC